MGSKFALVINGDREARHLENVERSLKWLKGSGYETYVANPERTKTWSEHNAAATSRGVKSLVSDICKVADGDDEFLIYVTGHGAKFEGDVKLVLDDIPVGLEFADILERVRFSKRTVIMDQCFGGNWANKFMDDPNTLFISAGSKNEATCCEDFAPYFWQKKVPDLNNDGVMNWQERFAYAVEKGAAEFYSPRFTMSAGYKLDGKPTFSKDVPVVTKKTDFKKQLKSLSAGQFAVVLFSADWCPGCVAYKPEFKHVAEAVGGQHNFMVVKNPSIGEKYEAHYIPSVVIIDSQGNYHKASDIYDLTGELARVDFGGKKANDSLATLKADPRDAAAIAKEAIRLKQWDLLAEFLKKMKKTDETDADKFRNEIGWAIINTESVSDLPSNIIVLASELTSSITVMTAALELLMAKEEWNAVKEMIVYSSDRLNNTCTDELVYSVTKFANDNNIPDEVIAEALKAATSTHTGIDAFDILMERHAWSQIMKNLRYAKEHYTGNFRNRIGRSIAAGAVKHSIDPDIIKTSLITCTSVFPKLALMKALISQKAWSEVKEALENHRDEMSTLNSDELARIIVHMAKSHSIPSHVIAKAFETSGSNEPALAAFDVLMRRKANAEIKAVMEYSKKHFNQCFNKKLDEIYNSLPDSKNKPDK